MQKKEIINWIINLRAISAIAVVLIHVCVLLVYFFSKIPINEWWIANLYMSACRFCVPVFIMITGALTLGKAYDLKSFFKKKFSRILIPFIFWSLIYIFSEFVFYYFIERRPLILTDILRKSYLKLFFGASYQMWYVYMLIGLYLIHPIINKWIIQSTKLEIIYFLSICLFASLINYFPFEIFKSAIELNFFSKFIGYLVAGYFISHLNFNKKYIYIYNIICWFIFFSTTFAIAYNTYLDSIKNNRYTEAYSPWDIASSIAIFISFKNINFFNRENKLLSLISKYSYGIYLIHVLIITIISNYILQHRYFYPVIFIPILTIFIITISITILYLIDKLPFGKYITK